MTTNRSLTFVYASNISDDAWQKMMAELTEAAEQAACDYAASAEDDTYALLTFASDEISRGESAPASSMSELDQIEDVWATLAKVAPSRTSDYNHRGIKLHERATRWLEEHPDAPAEDRERAEDVLDNLLRNVFHIDPEKAR